MRIVGQQTQLAQAQVTKDLGANTIVPAIGLESELTIDWSLLGLAVLLSAVSAWTCIHLFLQLINRIGMMPFVIYRLALGAFLLYLFA